MKFKRFYLIAFIFLSLFICVQSVLPSGVSSIQSTIIATIFNKGQKGDKEVLPEAITLSGIEYMNVGESQQLEYSFFPDNTSDKRVKWVTDYPDLVSISEKGNIVAKKEGVVTIEVTSTVDPSIHDTHTITISPIELESISISLSSTEISVGVTTSASLSFNPTNATYKEYSWHSTNEEIATINNRGIIKGLNPGTTSIYVQSDKYPSITSNFIEIIVNNNPIVPVTSIDHEDIDLLYVGQKIEISLVFNENVTDSSYYLQANDASIVSLSNNKIIGKKEGSTSVDIISNSNNHISKTINITVKEVDAISIKLKISNNYYYHKANKINYEFISKIDGLPVTNKKVHISSSNEKICSIDENGYLYGKELGTVTITIKWDKDETVQCSQVVNFVAPDNSFWTSFVHYIRKIIGHFSLFFLTGIFGILTFLSYFDKIKKQISLLLNMGYGLYLAAISELLQLIPKGRSCTIEDILIDFIGYTLGCLLILAIIQIYNARKRKKHQ